MHWYLTIPFLFGIMLSPQIEMAWWWQLTALLVGLLVMWGVFQKKATPLPLFLLNSFLMGLLYYNVRTMDIDGAQDEKSVSFVRNASPPSQSVLRLEEYLTYTQLTEEHRHVLNAMLLGDRSQLDKEHRQLYRRGGAQHLLALSGMHLGILLALLGILFLPRVRFSRWRWVVLSSVLLLMWGYLFMVGVPKSLLRAVLMSSIFLIGKFSFRPARGYEVLGTTVLVMLAIDPLCAFDIGAQLSVVALVGLTCFYPALDALLKTDAQSSVRATFRMPGFVRSFLRFFFVSLSAWMFTMPLLLYYFHQLQPWQPIVSIVLIPLTSLVLYGAVFVWICCVTGCNALANGFSSVLDGLMNVQDEALHISSSLPLSNIEISHVTLWQVLLLYILFAIVWIALRYRTLKIQLLSFASGIFTILLFYYLA